MELTYQDQQRDLGTWFAMALAIVTATIFGLSLALAGNDFGNPASVSGEPAQPPQQTDRFAPGIFYQTDELNDVVAAPALCQGEGLVDSNNLAVLAAGVDSISSYCAPQASFANAPVTGLMGDGPADPMNAC